MSPSVWSLVTPLFCIHCRQRISFKSNGCPIINKSTHWKPTGLVVFSDVFDAESFLYGTIFLVSFKLRMCTSTFDSIYTSFLYLKNPSCSLTVIFSYSMHAVYVSNSVLIKFWKQLLDRYLLITVPAIKDARPTQVRDILNEVTVWI